MRNRVIAFYGFKGGTGRSFLLANTAAILSALGRKVLVIDSDLEAPGIGDFFDAGRRVDLDGDILNQSSLSSSWRSKKGFLDLMSEITEADFLNASDEILPKRIEQLLMPNQSLGKRFEHDYLTEVAPVASGKGVGKLFLLGPGRQKVTHENGSFDYVLRILEFDWSRKVQSEGVRGFAALKNVLTSGLFDDVLIDGRTGYNLASLVTIQNLATDVVMVGSSAMQSIDGIARIRPIFTGTDPTKPDLRAYLVISKGKGSQSIPASKAIRDQAYTVKMKLNREYYHPGNFNIHELPFVEDFVTGESQLFGRLDHRRSVERESLITPEKQRDQVENYKDKLLEFLRDLYRDDSICDRFNADGINKAFSCWDFERSSGRRSAVEKVGPAFKNATSLVRTLEEAKCESDSRIAEFQSRVNKIFNLVVSMTESADSSVSKFDEKSFKSEVGRLTSLVQRSFLELRMEERAFVQAWVDDTLHKCKLSTQALKTVNDNLYEALYLDTLPHLVTNLQLSTLPQANDEDRDGELHHLKVTDEFSDYDISTSGPAPRVTSLSRDVNSRNLKSLCMFIVRDSGEDGEKIKEFLQDELRSSDPQYIEVLTLLEKLAIECDIPSVSSVYKFAVYLSQNSTYLPQKLSDFLDYSVFDVGRTILIKRVLVSEKAGMADAVVECARAGLAFLRRFIFLPDDEGDSEISGLLIEITNWLTLWTKAIVVGRDFFETNTSGQPQIDDLEAFLGLANALASDEDRALAIRMEAMILRLYIYIALDHPASVFDTLEESLTILNKLSPKDLCQREISVLSDIALNSCLYEYEWRFRRLLAAAQVSTQGADQRKKFDFLTYSRVTVAFLHLGGAVSLDKEVFPKLPSQLISSDREYVESEIGWFRYHSAYVFGRFRELVISDDFNAETSKEKPRPGMLRWLADAYANIGESEAAIETFKKWAALAKFNREDRNSLMTSLFNVRNSILALLLAEGDIDSFDEFVGKTDCTLSDLLSETIGYCLIEFEMLLFKRNTLWSNKEDKQVAAEAASLMSRGIFQFRKSPSPGDLACSAILGGTWNGLGAFCGYEVPNFLLRSRVANFLLDGLELVAEPDGNMLALVERLIWGNDDRAVGKTDCLKSNRFLGEKTTGALATSCSLGMCTD